MKKKTIKKMLAAMLAATLVSGCFTACGNEPANNVGESKESVAAEATEKTDPVVEEPKEPVEIICCMYETKTNVWDDLQAVQDAINEYIETESGVRIKITHPSEYGGDLTMALAAGEDIDLFWVSGTKWGPELMTNDAAYDLTDIVKEYPDVYNLLPEDVWVGSTYQGRNYYIPVPKESATGMGLLVPTDYVTKYNWDLSTVKELKDIEPMLKQLHDDGVDYAFLNHTNTYTQHGVDDFAFIKSYAGVARNGDTTKIVSIYESDEYKEYIDLKYAWNQAGYINQAEIEKLESSTVKEVKNAREVGFFGFVTVPDAKANGTGRNPFECEFVPFTENYVDTGSAFGSAYMINSVADEETVEACMKFINILFTDEKVANLLTYGIEGQHYELIDGKISLLADPKYKTSGLWTATAFNATTLLVGESDNKEALYKEFNENAVLSCTAGFSFDKSNVEAEIAACDAAEAEYKTLLEKGFYNPDEYIPIMVEALKKAGLDKIIAEMQTQYDAWLASK